MDKKLEELRRKVYADPDNLDNAAAYFNQLNRRGKVGLRDYLKELASYIKVLHPKVGKEVSNHTENAIRLAEFNTHPSYFERDFEGSKENYLRAIPLNILYVIVNSRPKFKKEFTKIMEPSVQFLVDSSLVPTSSLIYIYIDNEFNLPREILDQVYVVIQERLRSPKELSTKTLWALVDAYHQNIIKRKEAQIAARELAKRGE